jgi:hypothetical protein
MKNITILITAILFSSNIYSQLYLLDGQMIGTNTYGSSSRNVALGGATTALGGDLGSISQNPASIGVFRTGEFSFTPQFSGINSSNTYLNEKKTANKYDFSLGNLGVVFNYNTGNDVDWVSFNFAMGYNMINNLTDNYSFHGNTSNTSLLNEFANYANESFNYNKTYDAYRELLALDHGLIIDDTLKDWNPYYTPLSGKDIEQSHYFKREGNSKDYYFGLGANYNHQLYIGGTINIRSSNYEEKYSHTETDITSSNIGSYTFNKTYTTTSNGFSANIGIIYRPIETIRFGASIHSPVISKVNQEFNTSLKIGGQLFYPQTDNGYTADAATDNFVVSSPWRAELGAAYMFLQYGLISFDYEFTDYRDMNFSEGDYPDDIDIANTQTTTIFKATHNLRFGAEARMGSTYLRGGYALYQSPFASTNLDVDGKSYSISDKSIYSGGIGFKGNGFFVDFTYSYATKNEWYKMYDDINLSNAKMYVTAGTFMTTVGLKF